MRQVWAVALACALASVPVMAQQAGQPSGTAGMSARVSVEPVSADDPMLRSPQAPPAQSEPAAVVPVGARLDLRLQMTVDSGTARVDQRFTAATTMNYVADDGRVLVPAVSGVTGFVSSVQASNPSIRNGRLTLSFDTLRIGVKAALLRATVEQVFSGDAANADAQRLGADAVVGAAMGRVPGGGQRLLSDVMVDNGGSIVSTAGTDVRLPAGTVLRIRVTRAVATSGTR